MEKLKIFRTASPLTQLMFSFFVIILSYVVMMIAGIISGMLIFNKSIIELQMSMQNISSPENVAIMKYFQTIQSIGIFIIPPILIALFFSDYPRKYLHLDRITGLKSIFLVILTIYMANPLINYLSELNAMLSLPDWMSGLENWMRGAEEGAARVTEAFLATDTFGGLLFNIFMIGFLPAVGEELLFRGVIQRLFRDITRSNHAAIWISAALFSALHMQFYGFLPRMLLGAIFGYFLVWGGSLWVPIIAHFINNASAVVVAYLYQNGTIDQDFNEIGTPSEGNSYIALISLVFVITLMRSFYIRETRLNSENKEL